MLGNHVRAAYKSNDRYALKKIVEIEISSVLQYLDEFVHDFRTRWLFENKPQGFEVLDLRIGGVIARIENLKIRLESYLNGDLADLPELLQGPLYYDNCQLQDKDINVDCSQLHRISTPSIISIVIVDCENKSKK